MRDNKGFTIAELLAVIAILGVLMLVAVPKFSVQRYNLRDAAETLARDLRYAQQEAMRVEFSMSGSSENKVGVKIEIIDVDKYKIYFCKEDALPLTTPEYPPGERYKNPITLPSGISFKKDATTNYVNHEGYYDNQLLYNREGCPKTLKTNENSWSALDGTITLTDSSGREAVITVQKPWGKVVINYN